MPTTPTLETHDVTLGDGSTTIGLILVPDKSGVLLKRYPAQPLADQQFQTLGQAAFIPQQEAPFSVDSNHGGFGKERYASYRYRAAYGTDASKKGSIVLSPVIVQMTKTTPTYTNPDIANGGFELGAMTSWTVVTQGSDANWQAQSTIKRTGTYAARVDSDAGASPEIKQALSGDIILIDGQIITVSAWARRTNAGTGSLMRLQLKNNAGTQLAVLDINGGTTFVENTITYTVAGADVAGGIVVHVVLYPDSTNDILYLDDVVITGNTITTAADMGSIVKMIDFNSLHYCVSDTGVWKQTADNWARVAGSPAGITDCASDGTNLYLAKGTSLYSWYMNTSEVFTRIAQANSMCALLAYINGSMYGNTSATNVNKFTDITAGTVAASYTIGGADSNITAILDHLGYMTAVKENFAGYNSTSTTIVEIANELRSLDNANTGKNAISWRGNGAQTLYIPAGANSTMLAYDAGDIANMGPIEFAERLTDYEGQIVATASDDSYLFICLDNTNKIEILKGRYEIIAGVTGWVWHPFVEDTYGTVVGMHISSVVSAKRLYYFGGSTIVPKYFSLAGSSYATGGTHITCWIDKDTPNILKNWRSVAIRSSSLSAGFRDVKMEYNLDGETGWTELGGSGNGTFDISPFQEKFFGTSGSGVNSRIIQLRFTLYTTGATLEILDFTLNYVFNPPVLDIIEFSASIADDNKLINTGAKDTEQIYSKVAAQLRAWETTIPLTLTMPDGLFTATGGSHNGVALLCHFAPGYPYEADTQFARNSPVRKPQKAIMNCKFYQLRTS